MATDTFDLIAKQFWVTTFYQRVWPEHAARSAAIIDLLYSLKGKESVNIASGIAPAAKSPYGLFESNFDLFAVDHPDLRALRDFCERSVRLAVADIHAARAEADRLHVALVDSWFHITNDGGYHDAHGHGGCSWCGIYYLQAGESGRVSPTGAPNGGNRFYSPLGSGGCYRDAGNRYLDVTYVDPPARDGHLILFPSYLWHSALPYRGAKDRMIVSFNARVTLT